MRHGWTVFPARVVLVFSLGLGGVSGPARGGEPLDHRLGTRTVPILLLTRPDVQKALKLEPKQVEACQRAAGALQHRAAILKGRKDAGASAARRHIDSEMSLWLNTNLTAEQLDRLDQIDVQWEGASAMLSRPILDESLKLTPEQRKKVEACLAAGNKQRTGGVWTYEDHVNEERNAIAVLNEGQRALWVRVLGPPCPFKIAGVATAAQAESKPATGVSANTAPPRR